MRGRIDSQGAFFYSLDLEELVPREHRLREIKRLADEELKRLRPRFDAAYAKTGRPSIPPEQMIKALLLQALYSIRSERELVEQIGYNLLYRWFLGMKPDDCVWNHSSFTQNRERFERHGLLQAFFEGSVARAIEERALAEEEFSVDGSLIQSWASIGSFRPKEEKDEDRPGGAEGGFRGKSFSNLTHESKTDPQARLYRKGAGQEAKLSHTLHVLGGGEDLIVGVEVAEASGRAERREALSLLRRLRRRHRIRARRYAMDKGYDDENFCQEVQALGPMPDVAHRRGRERWWQSKRPFRRTQRARRSREKIFSWLKGIAGLKRSRFVGRWKIKLYALAASTAYNLMRLTGILRQRALPAA